MRSLALISPLFFLAACGGATATAPCGDGFGRGDDGNCYPIDLGDDTGDTDADADTDTDSDSDTDSDTDTDTDTDTDPPDTGDTSEPPDTGDTSEPPDTGDTSEPPDTGDTSEPPDTGDTSEPPDTGDTARETATMTIEGTLTLDEDVTSGVTCAIRAFSGSDPFTSTPLGDASITCPTSASVAESFSVSLEVDESVGTEMYLLASVNDSGTITDSLDLTSPHTISDGGTVTGVTFEVDLP